MSPQELKKALISAGFEVYRTKSDEIMLADRVRDNLILDSGVRVSSNDANELRVNLVMGIRHTQYPGENDLALFERVRQLAGPLLEVGFAEMGTSQNPVTDPSDASKTLDIFFDVTFGKNEPTFEAALPAVKVALEVAKTAESRH
ncbi:MAG: hypothetical protein ABI461_06225 [Polyangiaceae bacterium]